MTRIYLVDDHAMVREGIRAVLEAAGHQVVGETDQVSQALQDLQTMQPELVLLDLHLGEVSGLELLKTMRVREMNGRAVVLSMSAQPRHVAEALHWGACGYVLKGSPSSELLKAVEQAAAGRRYLGSEVGELALQGLQQQEAEADPMAGLSERERQILVRVVRGQSSAAIGQVLHLSPKTVDTYRSRLMNKLGVGDVTALVRWAIRVGLLDKDDG